jgi:hypothetical protein
MLYDMVAGAGEVSNDAPGDAPKMRRRASGLLGLSTYLN